MQEIIKERYKNNAFVHKQEINYRRREREDPPTLDYDIVLAH
jgi:hypothetical protein